MILKTGLHHDSTSAIENISFHALKNVLDGWKGFGMGELYMQIGGQFTQHVSGHGVIYSDEEVIKRYKEYYGDDKF